MDSKNQFEDLGFSKVDYAREERTGFPEVIFGKGKTVDQVRQIVERLMNAHGKALVTLATEEMALAVQEDFPEAVYNPTSRLITLGEPSVRFAGKVLVLCAGTSDLPV
ncbi:1-(5-phosphoribosyl)-5-amino-4-imidazole-carboxylate carboxylase, partial [Paenibacillus sepulcri]|nr:1-(5-phosphoribosyl)-5-amino-4-imidazole-carboxylate carboxylase [Paenibacillus sepulcri]